MDLPVVQVVVQDVHLQVVLMLPPRVLKTFLVQVLLLVLVLLELGDLDVQHDLLRGVQHPGRSPDAPRQIDLPSGHRQRGLHIHGPVGSAASSCVMVEVPGVVWPQLLLVELVDMIPH